MPIPVATVEELLATLERSGLPNLIAEGKTDFSLMRHVAVQSGGDCLPAGNRDAVLRVRNNASDAALHRTAFLVDSDLWVLDGVPAAFNNLNGLVITDGYSIENDLLRDANVELLIDPSEIQIYHRSVENACRWFCAGVTARRAGIPFDFNVGISSILTDQGNLTALANNHINTYAAGGALVQMVLDDYPRLLRGKTWMSVLNKIFCANGRLVNHQPMSLLTVGMRSGNQFSSRLKDGISARF